MPNKKRFFSEEEIMVELYDRVVHGSPAGAQFANAFSEFLKEIPTVDAVEVVRCKNCAFYEENEAAHTTLCRRGLERLSARPDGYCSYGERRTDNG